MVQGISEIAAMCVGFVGLIGAAATTGMPMWKVTAFIEENIIVMETRWEGLWMNCYRQANIRMQCKVYDSLLFLPPELQAARGLMCCSLALSGLGLLVALAGMKCISCFRGHDEAKTIMLMVAGGMQFMACICVFIPVSWTGHVIIRDFYNPLLIDAQRRELGEALYIGWVTGAVLFASAMLFLCRRIPRDKGSFDVYHPGNLFGYKLTSNKPTLTRFHPISSLSSLGPNPHRPSLPNSVSMGQQLATTPQNITQVVASDGSLINTPVVYNPGLPENVSLLYQGNLAHHPSMQSSNHTGGPYMPGNSVYQGNLVHHPSMRSSNHTGGLYTPGNSVYISHNSMMSTGNPTMSYQSGFQPVPQTPIFIGYKTSRIEQASTPSVSSGGGGGGVYI